MKKRIFITGVLFCLLVGLLHANPAGAAATVQNAPSPETARSSAADLFLDVKMIAAGTYHTCALTNSGGVKCWGSNTFGQLGDGTVDSKSVPASVIGLETGVQAIAVGTYHTCALTSGGAVKCWGQNNNGQLGTGSSGDSVTPLGVSGISSGATAIAAGDQHSCAVTASGAKCWGRNAAGQLGDGTNYTSNVPVNVLDLPAGIQSIVAGTEHTCALTASNGVMCWGFNSSGQLGDGGTTNSNKPVNVSGISSGVSKITAGYWHTCAAMSSGAAMCWGSNLSFTLGDGTTKNQSSVPVNVSGLTSGVTMLSGGRTHTCAVVNGGVKCWGYNSAGQLGDGTENSAIAPKNVVGLSSGFSAVAAGGYHTCALTTLGAVKCWGSDGSGQLGDAIITLRSVPVNVSLPEGAASISAGLAHMCAVTPGGAAKCWGANSFLQLGDGSDTNRSLPVNVKNLTSGVRLVEAGAYHACVVTTAGGVKCWGINSSGQLGDGTTNASSIPVNASNLASGIQALAAGGGHTCALSDTGDVRCWGRNTYGQLGDGSTVTKSLVPVNVSGLAGAKAVVAGNNHTCALTSANGVKCWGDNFYGQLGLSGSSTSNHPLDVPALTSGVLSIAAGSNHTCALLASGGVQCWGYNASGQLGDGSTDDRNAPTPVSGLASGIKSIIAGDYHTCAIDAGDGIQCWGYNYYSQLGNGTRTGSIVPVAVNGFTGGVVAMTAGMDYTCAITAGGSVKCWGSDGSGQLGIGATVVRLTPVDTLASASPSLTVNYASARPGSILTITGQSFPPNSAVNISINSHSLPGTINTDQLGSFIFFLDTENADPGNYQLTAEPANAGVASFSALTSQSVSFSLQMSAPLRLQEGGGLTITVPQGIAVKNNIYLPVITR